MTVSEYLAAIERKEQSYADLYAHFRAGHFTPAQYEAFLCARDKGPLQDRIDAFYNGRLFEAQTQSFEDWSNSIKLYDDRRRAEDFVNMAKSLKVQAAEIHRFMMLFVWPRRVAHVVLDKDQVKLAMALQLWTANMDSNGWRHWPKQKPGGES